VLFSSKNPFPTIFHAFEKSSYYFPRNNNCRYETLLAQSPVFESEKMVFLADPRQVGKTNLANGLMAMRRP
jgi:hypothetical protein